MSDLIYPDKSPGWEKVYGAAHWNLYHEYPRGIVCVGNVYIMPGGSARLNVVSLTRAELIEFQQHVLPQLLAAFEAGHIA